MQDYLISNEQLRELADAAKAAYAPEIEATQLGLTMSDVVGAVAEVAQQQHDLATVVYPMKLAAEAERDRRKAKAPMSEYEAEQEILRLTSSDARYFAVGNALRHRTIPPDPGAGIGGAAEPVLALTASADDDSPAREVDRIAARNAKFFALFLKCESLGRFLRVSVAWHGKWRQPPAWVGCTVTARNSSSTRQQITVSGTSRTSPPTWWRTRSAAAVQPGPE